MPVTIRIDGVPAVVSELKRLEGILSNNRPVFQKARERYSAMVSEVFASEGGKYGANKWADLSPMRQARRSAASPAYQSPSHPILQWSGFLKKAATWTQVGMHGWTDSQSSASAGTSITYYATDTKDMTRWELIGQKIVHDEGGKFGKYILPQRTFWPWNSMVESYMTLVWSDYLDNVMK